MKHTLKCIVHIETHFLNEKCKYLEITGAQPGKFQDTWYFLEWRHFDKHFINNRPTRSSTQKNFLKSAFQMICLTYRCTQSAYLFSKPGHFFRFSERSRRGLACSRSVLQKQLLWKTLHCIIVILFWRIPAKEPVFNKVATSNFIYLTTCNFTLTQAFSPKFRISTSRGHKDSLS